MPPWPIEPSPSGLRASQIRDRTGNPLRRLSIPQSLPTPEETLAVLCREVSEQSKCTLVFCATKESCEKQARASLPSLASHHASLCVPFASTDLPLE